MERFWSSWTVRDVWKTDSAKAVIYENPSVFMREGRSPVRYVVEVFTLAEHYAKDFETFADALAFAKSIMCRVPLIGDGGVN
ncbi:MAG TPA: hypothetical protein VKT83_07310 [bacterium]|nr:hypothetical protein [bacterium]